MIMPFASQPMMLLGDFNVDVPGHEARGEVAFLQAIHFRQLVHFPTTIHNTIIDHVWVNDRVNVTNISHLETYHSDHFPIVFNLSL